MSDFKPFSLFLNINLSNRMIVSLVTVHQINLSNKYKRNF